MKYLLYLATILSIITYSFWTYLPKGFFYYGNALFISIICAYIYFKDKRSFIKFVLFELSVANIFKELFLDPGKLRLEEALLIVIVPFIWYLNMVSIIEYWKEISYTIGGIVAFLVGRKSTKILEKRQTVDAIDAMQKTYDIFLKHYQDQYNALTERLNNLELRNAVLTESAETWEKKFKDLSKLYETLKKEFEVYKAKHK